MDPFEAYGKYELDPIAAEFIRDVTAQCAAGVQKILFWSGNARRHILVTDNMSDEKIAKVLKPMNKTDLFMTPNTYVPSSALSEDGKHKVPENNARESNLFAVTTCGIDVDYKTFYEKRHLPCPFKDPRDFYDFLMETVGDLIPKPSWIEYGHQLRLIYILSEPIYMKTINPVASQRLYKGLKAVMKRLCAIINDELGCDAEPQKAWYRLPGSLNTKVDGFPEVKMEKIEGAERYTTQELMTEYLPSIPYSREEYAEIRRKIRRERKNYKPNLKSVYTLGKNRCEDYERLAFEPGIPRELLLFLYGVAYMQCHKNCTREELMSALYTFNMRYEVPLKKKEVESKMRTLFDHAPKYKFSNNRIMEMLHIDESTCKALGLHLGASKKNAVRKKKAEAKASWKAEAVAFALEKYRLGMSVVSIASELGTSVSNVRNMIRPVRESMDSSAKASLRSLQRNFKKAAAMARLSFRKKLQGLLSHRKNVCGTFVRRMTTARKIVGYPVMYSIKMGQAQARPSPGTA